jgi:hypothetical protein
VAQLEDIAGAQVNSTRWLAEIVALQARYPNPAS